MKKIALSGEKGKGLYVLIDDEDFDKLNRKWHLNNKGYAKQHVWNKVEKKYETLFLHNVVMGGKPAKGFEVDHIDRNPLNNQKSNLRVVTHQQNNFNKSKNKNNTSGLKGVYFDKRRNKWYAKIEIDYKQKYLGSAFTIEEAHRLRLEGERKYHETI